ncbi:Ig-like domain-containing protein [Enterobacter sp. BNK-29]|uniref:hypothetical protein n=1 Tax=Enterobacter sp. BNK-29 TaxID=3376164 RepID=UPI003B50F8B5
MAQVFSSKTVAWSSTGGTLSTASSQTGSAGGATPVKLTSDTAGTFTVTGTVDGIAKSSEKITFTAPAAG